jgi:UDP:flavonoid glycosyltransferase YjiC (YdhE family)
VNQTNSRRLLFVLWDGGGTIPPALALARRVVAAGHTVRVLGPRSIENRVKALGAEFSPYLRAPDRDPRSSPGGGKVGSPASVAFGACAEYADDVKETIATSPVDLVVTDYILTGSYVAAEAAGVPCASLVPTVFPLPARGLPPFGSGFSLAEGLPGRVRDSVVNFLLQRLWNVNLKGLNETRTRFGLSSVKSIKDQMLRAGRMLVLSSSAFDFPVALPPHAVYCGPQLEDASQLPSWQPPWPADDKTPLALVSLSTTYQAQEDIIRRLLQAVGDLPAHVVVTLGYAMSPDRFQAPANTQLVPFVPHQQILPHTTLAITHGGHGTVLGALSYGVPLICMPMGRDQGDVAARVVWRGAGIRISPKATPRAFRSAITRVLNDSHYRDAARTIASNIARSDEPARAVLELEALILECRRSDGK